LGSLAVETICRNSSRKDSQHWLAMVGRFVIAANLIGFLVIPFLSNVTRWFSYQRAFPAVVIAAAALGAAFPLVAHAAIPPDSRSGARLSYLYLSNIVGSAAGSFIIGFILFDHFTLRQISLALALAGIATGAVLLVAASARGKVVIFSAASFALACTLIALSHPLFDRTYERLFFKSVWKPPDGLSSQQFQDVIETKSGVVTVSDGWPAGRLVIGDGALEARFTTDLHFTSAYNFLTPPYALSAIHPNPKRVLMIGLGCGSWAEIIANHPQLEKLTVIEINPGYLTLIARYPEVAALLHNPKVEIVIDDGRRWLVHHPSEQFDVIVMNTMYHLRNHASALLSVEFAELARRALKPGGIWFYNTTFSTRALRTGIAMFPYGVRVRNCLAASDSPIVVDKERWRRVLQSYKMNGHPVFDEANDRLFLDHFVSLADTLGPNDNWDDLETRDNMCRRLSTAKLITDDNMGDEWDANTWY
jgi:spermidine synthase